MRFSVGWLHWSFSDTLQYSQKKNRWLIKSFIVNYTALDWNLATNFGWECSRLLIQWDAGRKTAGPAVNRTTISELLSYGSNCSLPAHWSISAISNCLEATLHGLLSCTVNYDIYRPTDWWIAVTMSIIGISVLIVVTISKKILIILYFLKLLGHRSALQLQFNGARL